ncbi:ATP dependent DNA ligase [Dendrothele bispora CBS 962.96]|uniref:ATP dependent DNA ligase n=1 Tax=Dendrothele bispora (strain CBS 962.96) TaxID=1314807 RepID=A0A4S8MJY2_DENBC|nr:ATP dependent DNA ligase [Dendrothele bispora CBS 962.96]
MAKSDIVILKTHGFIGLFGDQIDCIANSAIRDCTIQEPQAHIPFHVTLVTKEELKTLSDKQIPSLDSIKTDRVYSAGVGGNKPQGVYFVVIIWAEGQLFRKRIGLPPKQFHITLTRHDSHAMEKGIDSLLHDQFPSSPSLYFLDHLAFTLHISSRYVEAQSYSVRLAVTFPASHRGFLRLADAAYKNCLYKLAMLSYACAFERAEDEKIRKYAVEKIRECAEYTEWERAFQQFEISQLPGELSRALLSPWKGDLQDVLSGTSTVPTLCVESRVAMLLPNLTHSTPSFSKLPRFFRWLIPFRIALMSTPKTQDDIDLLSTIGIKTVLTLTEEEPLPESWFNNKPTKNVFLPVPNYYPPSVEQMDFVMRLISDGSNLPILIHCGGGKGRAGTVAACYLTACGFGTPSFYRDHPALSAPEAISVLRSIRPGSIETRHQEEFVSKWCSTIWKRQSILPDLPSEPPPCPLEIEGTLHPDANLFILVGLPGSGKSWISQSLLARDSKYWTRISQDENGSRASCETEISYNPGSKNRVILDRCNTSAKDRKSWLDLASNWVINPVCVWFDYEKELCLSRAQTRAGHPTLPPGGRVNNAVEQMSKIFIKPSLGEGFKAIVIIRSFAAAQESVSRFSPPVNIYKFPRTPHIINLGAVTSDDVVLAAPMSSDYRVVITEKVDGANMGFSLSSDRTRIVVQNRSHYINFASHEQFKKLDHWIDLHREELYNVLDRDPFFAERYILFGEWLYATHSIPYTRLPDRFMGFDLYDRTTDTFADRKTLEALLGSTSIALVPVLYEGQMPGPKELERMVQTTSSFYDGRLEGVYLKGERNGNVVHRGKVVRADFIAGNEHWSKGNVQVNGLVQDHAS